VWQLLIFVFVWLSFSIVFAGVLVLGTLWLQGYFYTEPATGLLWRGPAAGAALGLLLTLWCLLSFLAPGDYDTLWSFSLRQKKEFPDIKVVKGNETLEYEMHRDPQRPQGRVEYVEKKTREKLLDKSKVAEIIVDEEGKEVHFKVQRWTEGSNKDQPKREQGEMHWVDDRGRVMAESDFGRIYTLQWVRLLLYFFLNVCHLLLWFGCLWLLLRFQWAHALGLAVILWLVMTIPVLPILLDKAAELGREQAKHKADAGSLFRCALADQTGGKVPKSPRLRKFGSPPEGIAASYKMCMMSPSWTRYVLPSSR
jgi:hypothetical protein